MITPMKPAKIHLTQEELDERLRRAYHQGKADGLKEAHQKYNLQIQNTLLSAVNAQNAAMESLTKLVQCLKH